MEFKDRRGVAFVPGEHAWTDRPPTSAASAGPMPAMGTGAAYSDWHSRYYASTRAAQDHGQIEAAQQQVGEATRLRQEGKPAASARALTMAGNLRRNAARLKNAIG